jgi:hypothetical protein
MKNTQDYKSNNLPDDDLLPEYNFDYRQGQPNRFIRDKNPVPVTVTLDPDIAEVFTTSESVNQALRALLSAIPQPAMKKHGDRFFVG